MTIKTGEVKGDLLPAPGLFVDIASHSYQTLKAVGWLLQSFEKNLGRGRLDVYLFVNVLMRTGRSSVFFALWTSKSSSEQFHESSQEYFLCGSKCKKKSFFPIKSQKVPLNF